MKHKIKFIEFDMGDDGWGTRIEIDGRRLFYDGQETKNCLEEILQNLDIEYQIEYFHDSIEKKYITKKMKLVPDEDA